MRRYTIILHPDPEESGYTVTVPALPGCATEGDSLEDVLTMAKDAIISYLEPSTRDGEPRSRFPGYGTRSGGWT